MAEVKSILDMSREYFGIHGRVLVGVITQTETMERKFIVLRTTTVPRVKRNDATA
jgi:hypothetical protein